MGVSSAVGTGRVGQYHDAQARSPGSPNAERTDGTPGAESGQEVERRANTHVRRRYTSQFPKGEREFNRAGPWERAGTGAARRLFGSLGCPEGASELNSRLPDRLEDRGGQGF